MRDPSKLHQNTSDLLQPEVFIIVFLAKSALQRILRAIVYFPSVKTRKLPTRPAPERRALLRRSGYAHLARSSA